MKSVDRFPMISAYIPLRLQSSRVHNKNFRILAGKCLYEWIFDKFVRLKEENLVSKVYIDYDDDDILGLIKEKYFNSFCFFKRDKSLVHPETTIIPLLESFITNNSINGPILQTHVTNPLVPYEAFKDAIERSQYGKIPLFSVTAHQKRFFSHNGDCINHDLHNLVSTQDLQPLLEENSCIYIFDSKEYIKEKVRTFRESSLFYMNSKESMDIDTEVEFEICDVLMQMASKQ